MKNKITIEKLAQMIQRGFDETATKIELKEVKQDVFELKKDMSGVKQDVFELKKDISEVKQDVKWMKDNSSQLFEKLDKFIKLYEDQRQELLLFGVQLKRLEERMDRIEAKK